ncbi:2-succinylbenzoate--CoA ligase, chloroplastic/peroxisomal isoform X1 [Aristolochia californica]|uniref:2-succinylbenzoate--CoA ligase, chloroplastic/peroxisomal isoform X1 n=1 Tax=Aristolochia californica TaxID=171875 RepID=UPI0035DD3363
MMAYSQGHICQCLTKISTSRLDFPVTLCGNRQKTGFEFVRSVQSLAQGLTVLGVRRGDVVAIVALNSDWYLEWLLAIAFIGGIAAPLNYRWSFQEARWAMELVGPVMLVVDDSCQSWWSILQLNQLPTLRTIIFLNDSPPDFKTAINVLNQDTIRKPLKEALSFDYISAPQGISLICFTSGTTGKPKGVAISHTALIVQSLAKIATVGFGEDDVYLHTAPLCHIGGISSAMAMLMVGGYHIFIPKFEAKAVLTSMELHKVTSLITVPAIMADFISVTRGQETWSGGESVKKILNGGGALSVELIEGAIYVFPKAKLFSAYGMTEACSSITFMTLWDPTIRNSTLFSSKSLCLDRDTAQKGGGICVGKPAPHVELLVRPNNHDVNNPAVGRILTRGSHLMIRYWDQIPAMTSDSKELRWLDTGDIGYIDSSGNLWLVGRAKDQIKTGGENVYPQEVEAVISQHPGVSGIVVVGVPHVRLTEMVAACVQIRDNWLWEDQNSNCCNEGKDQILSERTLKKFCRERNLSGFKIPKLFILWRKPFPVTTTGKVRRDEVKREIVSRFQVVSSNL